MSGTPFEAVGHGTGEALPAAEAHRPPPGVDEDDDEDERPIGDPDDDEDWDGDEDEDDDEEPLQVRDGAAVVGLRARIARPA